MHFKFNKCFWYHNHNAQTSKLWHILHVHFLFGMSGLTALPESFGLLEVLQGSCLLYKFCWFDIACKAQIYQAWQRSISTMQVWVYLTTSLYPCQKASVHPARFASATHLMDDTHTQQFCSFTEIVRSIAASTGTESFQQQVGTRNLQQVKSCNAFASAGLDSDAWFLVESTPPKHQRWNRQKTKL